MSLDTVDPIAQEILAEILSRDPDYRILHRFAPRGSYAPVSDTIHDGVPHRVALFVDVETTGLDPEKDRIIELSVVPFEFDACGNIYDVFEPHTWLQDPGMPIPPEVTAITGITDDDVRGKSIDVDKVNALLADASLVVSHHADFDRRFAEHVSPGFSTISWGCSYKEVDWDQLAITSKKLVHLLQDLCGEFYDAHRAELDCLVGIHLLASARLDDRPAFAQLLDSVKRSTFRLWAISSPFEMKDTLKARGYQWSDGSRGRHKAWYRDMAKEECLAERAWLIEHGRVPSPRVDKHTARERYSSRMDQ